MMRIAVQGCCHGELPTIYKTLQHIENSKNIKIDLLLICGDFQSIRNLHDLNTMSVPDKFKELGEFYKYYNQELVAPIPTIFIGGNHEASNYLWELFYGGWVCPNIYYLGNAGVVNFGGLRIGGLSGIFKEHNYHQGFFEQHPLRGGDIKSIYHVRKFSVFKLAQLKEKVHVMMSHDWPLGIAKHGNLQELMRFKSFLRKEIEENTLGSPPAEYLMKRLKPEYWFSAHLHVKYAAIYDHDSVEVQRNPDEIDLDVSSSDDDNDGNDNLIKVEQEPTKNSSTKFLALDKCIPSRQFLQILEVDQNGPLQVQLDPEWLSITKATEQYMDFTRQGGHLPSDSEIQTLIHKARQEIDQLGPSILEPPPFSFSAEPLNDTTVHQPPPALVFSNHQTRELCTRLGIENRINPQGIQSDSLEMAKQALLSRLGL